jgi:hypothetical protein
LNDKVKEDETDRECTTQEGMTNACKVLVGKSNGKRPLGRCRHKQEDNIKTYM